MTFENCGCRISSTQLKEGGDEKMSSVFELTFSVKKIISRQDTTAVIVANNLQAKNTVVQRHLSRTMRVIGEFRKIYEKDTFFAMAEIKNDNRNGIEYIELQSIPTLLNPENEDAMIDFLCSRVSRLGKKNATAIIKHLGLSAVNKIIANDAVLLSVPNFACSTKRAIQIATILRDCATIDQIGIFIQSIGLPLYIANDIYKKYENNSMRVIHSNPYSICYDGEISFKAADQIAEYLQFDVHNPVRVQTAIISYLNYIAFSGHTCYPRSFIYGNDNDSLNNYLKFYASMKDEISDEEIDDALRVLVDDKKVHIGMNMMGEEFIYLYHYFSVEQNVVYQIKQLLMDKSAYCDENYVIHFLNNYTNGSGYQLDPLQREAVLTALSSKIMILTGGPGTGKTATVNMIVECIGELTKDVFGRTPIIKLLAPTGKAAERMSEMTERSASTIHKELKILEDTNEKQNENYKIIADYVIVDESSMIDINLMNLLLGSLNENIRIIFVGDDNQLPSVGPGCVLKDFINSGKIPTIKLKTIFRQKSNSTIVTNSHKAIAGYGTKNGYVLNSGDCHFYPENNTVKLKNKVVELYGNLLKKYSKEEIMVLTPMKNGDIGVDELNRVIQEQYNTTTNLVNIDDISVIKVGDKVIQVKNLYRDGLDNIFNGLIGEVLVVNLKGKAPTITVKFEGIMSPVIYSLDEIKEYLMLAYALTIHKSQGSEFPVIIVPIHKCQDIMLNRNLFYTAITRAREFVYLVGQEDAINKAIRTKGENRYSLLSEKLQSC